MLKVKTKLDNDNYGGFGLFANQPIDKNEIVWQYDPRFTLTFSQDDIAVLPSFLQDWVNKYAYNFCNAETDDVFLDIDDSRFMNHADDPTTYYDSDTRSYRASRNIVCGEELTINYRDFCEEITF
jgi:uncharacterized protein